MFFSEIRQTTLPLILLVMLFLLPRQTAAETLAVIVNPQSEVSRLSNTEVMQIFMGKAPTFPNGKPLKVVYQREGSEVRTAFEKKALKKDSLQVKAYWVRMLFTGRGEPPPSLADGPAVTSRVAGDPKAVGYVKASDVNDSVRVVFSVD